MAVTIEPGDLASPDARSLTGALDEYLNTLYPPEENFLELPARDVDGERGIFLVARENGGALGCAAVRRISEHAGEVKRMYVVPSARGRGIGRRLIESLEAWARSKGIERLLLETGPDQGEAIRLFEAAGFTPVPCFGAYANAPQSRCFAKELGPEH